MRRFFVLGVIAGALIVIPVAVYATHSFKDVPSSNTFHADIDSLKNSGVTKGCNPPVNDEFCPKDPVTREQMSAFMRRLAELQVVDAGTLDGKQGVSYGNPAASVLANAAPVAPSSLVKLAETTISVPAAGGLIIDATALGATSDPAQPGFLIFWIQVDNTTCNGATDTLGSVMFGTVRFADSLIGSGSITGTASVGTGNHTVTLCGGTALSGVTVAASLVGEYTTSLTRSGGISLSSATDLADALSEWDD